MDLYEALILRLRADAAAAVTEYVRARGKESKPVEIVTRRLVDGGRWIARVKVEAGWLVLAGYEGEFCDSEAEALCSLIERAHRDAEAAGGNAPFHLVARLAEDAKALAVYRAQTCRIVRGVLTGAIEAIDALDEVDEASGLASEQAALRTVTGEAHFKALAERTLAKIARHDPSAARRGPEEGGA